MKVRCLSKNRNNKGVIVSYNLQDETGRQFQATGQQIKEEMRKGQFQFVNLQIDRAGRLVDKAEEKSKKVKPYDEHLPSTAVNALLNGETIHIFIDNKNKIYKASKSLDDFLNIECNISHLGGLVIWLHEATEKDVYFIYAKDSNKIEVVISLDKSKCKIDLSTHQLENATHKCCYANGLGECETPVEVKGTILQCVVEKKSTPKDIVKEFLSHINETYNDKISGVDTCEQFINDYTGKGNVAWDEELERGCIKIKMPKEVKVYFKTLVDSIEKQARESYVTLYDPFEEEATLEDLLNNSHLPEKVMKFQKNTKCDFGIIKGLFKCVDKEDIARIRVQDDNCYINWMYDSEMLTANYEYARRYFKSALGLVAEFNEEGHYMDVEVEGNDIAQVFYIKYLAELSGRDLEFYKQQIIKKVKEFVESTRVQQSYRDVDVNVKIALQWALFGSLPDINRLDCIDKECRTFAAAYMALKHNVICHGDDDTNYYDYVKKEINELNKLV